MLTDKDIQALSKLIDQRLDVKLKPVFDFIDFAKPAIISLLEESQTRHEQKYEERITRLEKIIKEN